MLVVLERLEDENRGEPKEGEASEAETTDRDADDFESTLEALEAFTFAEYPAGTIRSNVSELARFLAAKINNGTYGNQQILKPASVAAMEEAPFPGANSGSSYGLGMFIAGDDLRAHGGDDAGAATDMAYNRNTKKGVIVLSNVTRRLNSDVIYQRMLVESELCP